MNWKKKLIGSAPKADKTLPTFIELTPQPDTTSPVIVGSQDSQPVSIELNLGAGIQLRISRAG